MTSEEIEAGIDELWTLPYDWDGEGSGPVSPMSISTIRRVWEIVKEHGQFVEWHITPMSGERCQLESCPSRPALEIEAMTNGTIHYLKWTGVDETTSEGLCTVNDVPDLLDWLRQELANAKETA